MGVENKRLILEMDNLEDIVYSILKGIAASAYLVQRAKQNVKDGELTSDPSKLVDSKGEAMSFNKVDKALQSVGISMKTVDGQFRDFDEVIIELAKNWNNLDSVSQRYISTVFAGNRLIMLAVA